MIATTPISRKPTVFIFVALAVLTSAVQVTANNQLAVGGTGVKPNTYMIYLIREKLGNGTTVQAIDYYVIRDVLADGSINVEVKWGVVGYATEPTNVHVRPIDPSDPELNTLSAIVNVYVPNGVYKVGRAITTVQRHVFRHNGVSFDGIVTNETIRDFIRPQLLLYQGIWYYDAGTGILLHSDYLYGWPTFAVGTIDLLASNAFATVEANYGTSLVQLSWMIVPVLLLILSFIGTRRAALRRARPKIENAASSSF